MSQNFDVVITPPETRARVIPRLFNLSDSDVATSLSDKMKRHWITHIATRWGNDGPEGDGVMTARGGRVMTTRRGVFKARRCRKIGKIPV